MKFGTTSARLLKRDLIISLYNDKYLLKRGSQYIYLSVVLIDSVFRADKNYYPQVFLEKCKYVVKDIEISSNESAKEESDEENSDKEDSDEENSEKKIIVKEKEVIRHITEDVEI